MGTVFILDDEEDILFILKYWLSDAGYDVHVFTTSLDLVRLLATYVPDIMLLDINLRNEDGREVCKMVRKEWGYDKPVLHVSANRYLFENASSSCANGFIPKPFDLEELTTTVQSFITK